MGKKRGAELPDLDVQPGVDEVESPFDWEAEESTDDGDAKEKEESTDDNEEKSKEDDKKNPEEDSNDQKDSVDEDSTSDDNDDSEIGEDVYESFFDVVADKIGLDIDDDFEKPKSADELAEFFDNLIQENSVPDYSDDRVRQLDEYLKNGGDFEKFYKVQKDSVSYDNINLEDEGNQRRILSDYLELEGYDDNQIARKIKKYEDTGILKDEADDALLRIKKTNEKKQKDMLKKQEADNKAYEESQRSLFENTINVIKNSDDIRGIKLSNKDKKELVDYMFKIQQNGKTKWQDEYGKSVNNMIESAFFTMRGDALINSIKKSGETSAAIKFKKSLASNKVKGTKSSPKTGGIEDFVSSFGL